MAEKTTVWYGYQDESFSNANNWSNGVPTSVNASGFYDTVIFAPNARRDCVANVDLRATDGNIGAKFREVRIEKGCSIKIGNSGNPLICQVITKFTNRGKGRTFWEVRAGSSGSAVTLSRFILDCDSGGQMFLTMVPSNIINQTELLNGTIVLNQTSASVAFKRIYIGANRPNEDLIITIKPSVAFNTVFMNGGNVLSHVFYSVGSSVLPAFHMRAGKWVQAMTVESANSATIEPDITIGGGRFSYQGQSVPTIEPNIHLFGGTLDLSEAENVRIGYLLRSEFANYVPSPSSSVTSDTIVGK